MAVGKGSIQRVKKAATGVVEETAVVAEAVKVVAEAEVKKPVLTLVQESEMETVRKEPKKKASAKKAPAKKPTAKKAPAKKPVASKKDDIHEKKFEMIDGIYTELPTYLL